MDINGRYEHIEDVLIPLRKGQWFSWSDSKNKVYTNLIIIDPEAQSPENKAIHGIWSTEKPTEKSLTDALAKQQSDFDAQEYARNRQNEYPTIVELTVALYDTDDKAALETKRAAVKTKWPKDNSGPVE